MKPRYEIDYVGLFRYLSKMDRSEVQGCFVKPESPKLVEGLLQYTAESRDPVRQHDIGYGEPFLCDLLGNDLSIGIHTRRKYKLPTGRAIHAMFDRTMIHDCWLQYGTPLNGVWKIPSQFLTAIGGATK